MSAGTADYIGASKQKIHWQISVSFHLALYLKDCGKVQLWESLTISMTISGTVSKNFSVCCYAAIYFSS